MKKSRVIIPALAMIAFAVAASVTGAVAWFTASRTANFSAGSYAVVKTNSDLQYKVKARYGCTVDTEGTTVSFGGKLTDGSFDHKDNMIYTPNASGTGLDSTRGETALADMSDTTMKRGETNDATPLPIYTAVAFDIDFTVTFGAVDADIGLFIDNTAGKTNFAVSNGADAVTATGFRMAFVPNGTAPTNSVTRATVLADLQTAANCKYIAGTTDTTISGTSYVAGEKDLIDSTFNDALPTETTERATAQGRQDYIGMFKFAASTQVTLKYTVVCWFEGTDPNIKNQALAANYQEVVANLYFAAVNLKASSGS